MPGPQWGDATRAVRPPQPACLPLGMVVTPSWGRVLSRPTVSRDSLAESSRGYAVWAWGHAVSPSAPVTPVLPVRTKCGSSRSRRAGGRYKHPTAGSGGKPKGPAGPGRMTMWGLGGCQCCGGQAWRSGGGAVSPAVTLPGGHGCRASPRQECWGTGWRGAGRRDGVTPRHHHSCTALWQ